VSGDSRTRGVAVLLAVGLVLLCGALAATGLAQDTGDDDRSIGTLVNDTRDQHESAETAVSMASSPVGPALLGGGLGVGIGAIAGAGFAYQNRGMR